MSRSYVTLSVSRSHVTRLFEVGTDFKNVFTLKIYWQEKNFKKLEKIFHNTASPLRQNKIQFFRTYCAWGEPFLELASLSTKRLFGLWQSLRHVARLSAPSTLAEERLPPTPRLASASSAFPALRFHFTHHQMGLMKFTSKSRRHRGFELETAHSAVECSSINIVNKSH